MHDGILASWKLINKAASQHQQIRRPFLLVTGTCATMWRETRSCCVVPLILTLRPSSTLLCKVAEYTTHSEDSATCHSWNNEMLLLWNMNSGVCVCVCVPMPFNDWGFPQDLLTLNTSSGVNCYDESKLDLLHSSALLRPADANSAPYTAILSFVIAGSWKYAANCSS